MIPRQLDIYRIANEALNYNEAKIKASERKKQEAKRAAGETNVKHDTREPGLDAIAGGYMRAIEQSQTGMDGAITLFKGEEIQNQIKDMLVKAFQARKPGNQKQYETLADEILKKENSLTDNEIINKQIDKFESADVHHIMSMLQQAWGIDIGVLKEKIAAAKEMIANPEGQKSLDMLLKQLGAKTEEGAQSGQEKGDLYTAFSLFVKTPIAPTIFNSIQSALKTSAPKIDEAINAVKAELGATDLIPKMNAGEPVEAGVGAMSAIGSAGVAAGKAAGNLAISGLNRIASGKSGNATAQALEATLAFFALYPFLAVLIGSVTDEKPQENKPVADANAGKGLAGMTRQKQTGESVNWYALAGYQEGLGKVVASAVQLGKLANSAISKLRFPLGKKYQTFGALVDSAQVYTQIINKLMLDNRSLDTKILDEFSRMGLVSTYDLENLNNSLSNSIDQNKLKTNIQALATKMNDVPGMKGVIKNIYASNGVKKSAAAKIGGALGKAAGAVNTARSEAPVGTAGSTQTNPPNASQGQ